MSTTRILLGQTLQFTDNPLTHGPEAALHHSHGAVAIGDGRILSTGTDAAVRAAHPQAEVTDYGPALILPGFVDAHAHYPQTAIIAGYPGGYWACNCASTRKRRW